MVRVNFLAFVPFAAVLFVGILVLCWGWNHRDEPLDFSALATAHDALARIWRKEQDATKETQR